MVLGDIKQKTVDTAKDTVKETIKETAKDNIKDKLVPDALKPGSGSGSGGGGGLPEKFTMETLKMFGRSFAIAGLSATVAKTLVAPLDTVSGSTAHDISVSTQQGYMTYWRGNLSNVVRAFPNEGLNFGLRDYYNHALGIRDIDARQQPWKYFWTTYFGGGAAGVVSLAVLYPIDAAYGSRLPTDLSHTLTQELKLKGGSMKDKFDIGKVGKIDPVKAGREVADMAKEAAKTAKEQAADLGKKVKETAQDVGHKVRETAQDVGHKVREGEYREAAEKLTGSGKTAHQGGVFGLYRGFMPSLMGAFVYRAAYFGLYDTVRAMYPDKATFLWGWAIAQATTTVSGFLAHPFDIIRHRMMTHRERYGSSWNCWVRTVNADGMSSLFRGASSNLVRSTGGALTLVIYDEAKKYLSRMNW